MFVDGMYQGCIMRNMRTWEASFNVPDSSKIKAQDSWKKFNQSEIIASECDNNLVKCVDQPNAWMHASSSSSTVADCSKDMDSIILPSLSSLVFLLTGCLALDRKQKRMKRANKLEKFGSRDKESKVRHAKCVGRVQRPVRWYNRMNRWKTELSLKVYFLVDFNQSGKKNDEFKLIYNNFCPCLLNLSN